MKKNGLLCFLLDTLPRQQASDLSSATLFGFVFLSNYSQLSTFFERFPELGWIQLRQ